MGQAVAAATDDETGAATDVVHLRLLNLA